jgi:YegS/Rv2252/BmrU family lipid kinase
VQQVPAREDDGSSPRGPRERRTPGNGISEGKSVSRAAVVMNATKLDDHESFKKAVREAMHEHGWQEPLWLVTTADDPGIGQAQQAVAAGVDLVMACGGDGTVTSCAEGIADSGVPLAIIPMGTGNLLARNVGLPATLQGALAVALTGTDQALDAGTANSRPFVVMAGLGLDARMLADASEPLKKRLGWAAYAVSVVRHLRDRPARVTLIADDRPAIRVRASAVIVGNVGWLRGGLPLLPDARPDDGMLDAIVITALGWAAWTVLAAHVLMRRGRTQRVTRFQFRRLQVQLERPQPWELDGEVMGTTRQLVVAAQPGRLLLRVPRPE